MKFAPSRPVLWLSFRRSVSLAGLLVAASLLFSACIGRPDWGKMCGQEGKVKEASDGCNTCICKDREWICSQEECTGRGPCTSGETKEDDCNTCACEDGQWLCTQRECDGECLAGESDCTPACKEGDTKAAEDACNACLCSEGAWVCSEKDCGPVCAEGDSKSAGDECNTCDCQDGAWVCTREWCGPRCADGEIKPAADDCNTCICHGGNWSCTLRNCSCSEGVTINANDGCNTCTCGKSGWTCTDKICGEIRSCGGDDCGSDNYCAFDYPSNCGATKGEVGLCRPRPGRCDGNYDPVCGCDKATYSNACEAARNGAGIRDVGACSEQ